MPAHCGRECGRRVSSFSAKYHRPHRNGAQRCGDGRTLPAVRRQLLCEPRTRVSAWTWSAWIHGIQLRVPMPPGERKQFCDSVGFHRAKRGAHTVCDSMVSCIKLSLDVNNEPLANKSATEEMLLIGCATVLCLPAYRQTFTGLVAEGARSQLELDRLTTTPILCRTARWSWCSKQA